MSRIRALLAMGIMICGLLLGNAAVSAASIEETVLAADDTAVRREQEVEFVLSLDGYDDIKDGVYAVTGSLAFDPNIFETPAQQDFEGLNSWERVTYNPESGQFTLISPAGSTQPGDTLRFTLTAKGEPPAGETGVRITGLSASDGGREFSLPDAQLTLSAVSEEPAGADPGSEGQAQHHSGNTADAFLPGWAVFALCGAAALLLAGCAAAVRRKKDGKGRKIFAKTLFIAAAAVVAAGGIWAFGGKGDLNGDGAVDDLDVGLLQSHLTALELLPGNRRNAADMNADGKLTAADLSLLVQKAEHRTAYTVALTSALDHFYYEKGEQFLWDFYADVSHGTAVRAVTVGGAEYEALRGKGGGYTVQLGAGLTPGVQALPVTEVTLHNGRKVAVDHTERIDVLKDPPSVENFLAEEKADAGQIRISFELRDPDSALLSAGMELLRRDGGEWVAEEAREISAGENAFVLDLAQGVPYTLHISAQYDRDSGELEAEADHGGSLSVLKELALGLDYRFTFSGLRTQTAEGVPSERFAKNEPVVLWFASQNAAGFRPERVIVNGAAYPVESSEDGYAVTLEGFSQAGTARIRVEQVILENGAAFTIERENEIRVAILKAFPTVAELAASENVQVGTIDVSFHLDDPDGALSDGKLLIRNAAGEIAGQLPFRAEDLPNGTFRGSVPLENTGLTTSYTVQVTADCSLWVDGSGIERQKVLAELPLKAHPRARITAGRAGAEYVEKGGALALFYEISDNVEAPLTKAVVNHIELPASSLPDGSWQVVAAAPQVAGEQRFILSQLVFADGTIVDAGWELSAEVMKSAPAVAGYETEEFPENGQIAFRFDLTDADSSFLSGRVELVPQDTGLPESQSDITRPGRQEFTFHVREERAYTFRVLLSWNRTEDGRVQQKDAVVFERPVYPTRDYGLVLSATETFSEDGSAAVYYEPESTVRVRFRAENAAGLAARQVQMNGRMYALSPLPGNFYEFAVPAGSEPGVRELTLEGLVLENGKALPAEDAPSARIEVLKAAPSVEGFGYEQTAEGALRVQFTLADPDGALLGAQLEIAEEDGRVLLTAPVSAGENEAEAALTGRERYVVRVTADYDRDTNALDGQSNAFAGEILFTDTAAVSRELIHLKDVSAATLFRADGSRTEEVGVLDITSGLPDDPENYYVRIEMESLPDFYAGIREFRQDADTGRVYAVVDQEGLAGEAGEESYAFPVAHRDEKGEHPLIRSAEELFRQMAADPGGSYALTEDLDASGIPESAAAVAGTFTGELDGNGYRILNLPTSLFQTLSGAHIHDLVIEDAQITASRAGILADVIQNRSRIERVFIRDSGIANGRDGLGAFAGSLRDSVIRESASIDVSVKGLVAVGGIVGKTEAGALIEDCYVTGKLQGSYAHPTLGARVGGIAGWHGGGVIRSCFTQVQVTAPAQKGNGGVIGGPNTGSPALENVLSMSTGAGYRIAGFDVLQNAVNLYEYAGSDSATNITEENSGQIRETADIFDRALYAGALGFDEEIWELALLSYGKRPDLKAAPGMDNNYGIPAYDQLRVEEGYRPDREQAYANLAKLMPFADIRTWVEMGNRLSAADPLAAQAVQFVLPLDGSGALVTGLHRDAPETAEKIRVVFTEGPMREYALSFRGVIGDLAAVYGVEGTELSYQFHRYLAGVDESLLEEAESLAEGYDYAAEIAALTGEEESRLYVDYYNETIRPALPELVEKLLLSQSEYPTYSASEAVQALARERVLDGEQWKRLLYGYNYFDKWYRIDFDGVTLSDLLFLSGELTARDMTAAALTEKLLNAPQEQRETHRTVVFYQNVLQNYTGEPLMEFLGGLARRMAGYADPSDWFAGNFDGILKEQPPRGGAEGIRYRVWEILSGLDDRRKSIVLPILTAPQEDMYLITLPSQLMLGSMNRYLTYLNKDGSERKRMEDIIDAYAEKMGIFYGVSSAWTDDAAALLNSFVNIQYDTRLNFPESPAAAAGDQDRDKTRDPVMKWVYEANNTISAKNGSAAFADGANVYWVLDAALGTSDYTFFTFSHETAHNQDGRYFYGGAGRRRGTGAEAHADGNIAQEMRDGCMVFNISKVNDVGVEMTGNFSYERIDSAEKIESYYREMFETGYVLDYLAAQAFLRLTPEEQAAVAVQADHTEGGNASFSTVYSGLTAEELAQMDLRSLDDLWENRISIRNIPQGGSQKVSTATDGSYGFESFYFMNWYQSHNDAGSPDTHSFKRLGMEMLGVGGYEDGYRIYMSALSENDLDALRKITGDPDITWKQYKLDRYQRVEENLGKIPYFDAETAIGLFQAAFEQDARNGTRSEGIAVKRALYGIVKRATDDFRDGGIYQSPAVIPASSAEELLRLAGENPSGFFRLEADLDFSGISAEGGSYLPERFIGILDGNGHALTGMQYPLFGDLQYALVKDLAIAGPSYDSGARAMLAVRSRQTVLGDISVSGLAAEAPARQLPLVGTKTDFYGEYGRIAVTAEEAVVSDPAAAEEAEA